MNKLFMGLLAIVATCASSVYAQTSYIVSEKALSSGARVVGSNEAGWYAVEGFSDSTESLILNGPKAYSRDISALAPTRSTNGTLTFDARYFVAVDGSGAVYFAQNVSRTDAGREPTYLGSVVKKLALNSNSIVDFHSDINDPAKVLRSTYRINTQGHLIKLQNLVSGTQNQLVLKKFVNGVESQQTIPFTEKSSDRNVLDLIDFDSTGGFAISRSAVRVVRSGGKNGRATSAVIIAGLCTGNVLSQELSCAATDTLNKKGFSVAGMSGGSVALTRTNMRRGRTEYVRFDSSRSDNRAAISIPQSLGCSSVALAANGDINNLQASSPIDLKKFKLVTYLEAGSKRKITCTMSRAVSFDNRTSDDKSVQELSDGGFLIFGGKSREPRVFELTPAGTSGVAAGAMGRCIVK